MRHQDEEGKIDTEKLSTSISDILGKTISLSGIDFEEIKKEISQLWTEKLQEIQ